MLDNLNFWFSSISNRISLAYAVLTTVSTGATIDGETLTLK